VVIEDMRKYVEAGLGSLTPSRAREMARSLLQSQGSEVNRVAGTLMEWSRRSRERITELVQSEVRRQLRAVGVATRDDLDGLRKRVRALEKAPAAAAPARSTGSRRSPAKKSAAKKPSAKKSTSGKSTAKRSSFGASSSSGSGSSSGSSSGSGSSS
jgi:polyhydroxyalkanoate synthesis regulator phasin